MRVKALRPRHIKKCMDEGTAMFRGHLRLAPPMVKSRIKTMFNLMLDYAVEYEIVDINHARSFRLSDDIKKEVTTVKNGHIIYTEDEMSTLWEYWAYHQGTENHAWTGGPLVLLSQQFAGIRPTSPGWRTFEVCPQLGRLTSLSCSVPTLCGEIHVDIRRKGETLTVEVEKPAALEAEVRLLPGSRYDVKSRG